MEDLTTESKLQIDSIEPDFDERADINAVKRTPLWAHGALLKQDQQAACNCAQLMSCRPEAVRSKCLNCIFGLEDAAGPFLLLAGDMQLVASFWFQRRITNRSRRNARVEHLQSIVLAASTSCRQPF